MQVKGTDSVAIQRKLVREIARLNDLAIESLDTFNAIAEALGETRARLNLMIERAATLASQVPKDSSRVQDSGTATGSEQFSQPPSLDEAFSPSSAIATSDPGTVSAIPEPPTTALVRRRSRQPLYMRIIFRPVLTDLVRTVRYHAFSPEQLAEALSPLRARYGDQPVEQAAAELLSLDNDGSFRLSSAAAKYAPQIIGHRPLPTREAGGRVLGEILPTERLLDVSKDEAVRLCFERLRAMGQPCRIPSLKEQESLLHFDAPIPDVVVDRGGLLELILVRRELDDADEQLLHRWRESLDRDSEASVAWPCEAEGHVVWRFHILPDVDESSLVV